MFQVFLVRFGLFFVFVFFGGVFFEVICPLISITPDMPGISMLKGNSRCLNLVFITFLMFLRRFRSN